MITQAKMKAHVINYLGSSSGRYNIDSVVKHDDSSVWPGEP